MQQHAGTKWIFEVQDLRWRKPVLSDSRHAIAPVTRRLGLKQQAGTIKSSATRAITRDTKRNAIARKVDPWWFVTRIFTRFLRCSRMALTLFGLAVASLSVAPRLLVCLVGWLGTLLEESTDGETKAI